MERSEITSDQWEAAAEHLFSLLVGAVEHPGAFTMEDLPNWLLMAGNERERQGDFQAAWLLDQYADRAKEYPEIGHGKMEE